MSKQKLKQVILDCCNDVVFSYNNKQSGITSIVKDYVPVYQVWHGTDTREYNNIEDVMNDKFFSGKSINDLIGKINFSFA